MSKDQNEQEFHNELDDAIDNLFNPYTNGEQDNAAAEPEQAPVQAETTEASEPIAADSEPVTSPEQADEFTKFEEILMTLEWEISQTNIDRARGALEGLKPLFDEEKTNTLAEIFSLMEQIFEAMSVAPQSVPTSAPKTLKEGLHALKAAHESDDMTLVEQTLIDPTLSELRSAVPQIPKDYSKGIPQEAASAPAATPESAQATGEEAPQEVLDVELPGPNALAAPKELLEVVNGHITILGKCIKKRIVPIENLFGKTPGYEKLHAIHAELRERLENQKQALINALGSAFEAGAVPPAHQSTSSPVSQGAPCPVSTVATTSWNGKTIAVIPEQIAFQGMPAKTTNGPIFPLKHLCRWPWGKVSALVKGELASLDEATLKSTSVGLASGQEGLTADLLILFNKGAGMGLWIDGDITPMQLTDEWSWEASNDPASAVAGQLKNAEQSIPLVTVRALG